MTPTKAADANYASTGSIATFVTLSKLPIPNAVLINFAANRNVLRSGARNQINVLVRKLTTHSIVLITGYARGNFGLSQPRTTVAQYRVERVRVKVPSNVTRAAQSRRC